MDTLPVEPGVISFLIQAPSDSSSEKPELIGVRRKFNAALNMLCWEQRNSSPRILKATMPYEQCLVFDATVFGATGEGVDTRLVQTCNTVLMRQENQPRQHLPFPTRQAKLHGIMHASYKATLQDPGSESSAFLAKALIAESMRQASAQECNVIVYVVPARDFPHMARALGDETPMAYPQPRDQVRMAAFVGRRTKVIIGPSVREHSALQGVLPRVGGGSSFENA